VKELFKQFSSLIGAAIAAACCLGIVVVLTAVGAVGLGFLIQDAYLFPIFVGFIGLNLLTLYKATKGRGQMAPFWLGAASGITSIIALWFMLTGIYPIHWLVYTSFVVLILASVWDFINSRKAGSASCETNVEENATPVDMNKRIATGAALSAGAAVAFYGLYKSVDLIAPAAQAGDVACWGINDCKGTTDCTTAYNSCNGQNDCKGKGFLNVPEKECRLKGGKPLEETDADPSKG